MKTALVAFTVLVIGGVIATLGLGYLRSAYLRTPTAEDIAEHGSVWRVYWSQIRAKISR